MLLRLIVVMTIISGLGCSDSNAVIAADPEPDALLDAGADIGADAFDVGVERFDGDWVPLPAGDFLMGSDGPEAQAEEQPQHRVIVSAFEIWRTEVTVAQYSHCVTAQACSPLLPLCDEERGCEEQQPDDPAAVDWLEARQFAEWVGGRLPSEAEWEYAARSGGRDNLYPWGNEPTPDCGLAVMAESSNARGCGLGLFQPPCTRPAGNTAHGLCDVAGNMWEWTEDVWHPSYDGAPTDGSPRTRAEPGERPNARVLRGGSWYHRARNQTTRVRVQLNEMLGDAQTGFRPARSPP